MDTLKKIKKYFHNISFYDYVIAIITGICAGITTWKISSTARKLNSTEQVSLFLQILLFLLVIELVSYIVMRQQFYHKINPIFHRATGAFLGVCVLIQIYVLYYYFVFL